MTEIDPHNPINKIAKRVVSTSKDQGTEFHPGHLLSSSLPLPITLRLPNSSTFTNLTGKVKSRLTVIGLSASFRGQGGKGLRWVVKCSCGRYEIRTTKTINKTNVFDACLECKKTQYLNQIND